MLKKWVFLLCSVSMFALPSCVQSYSNTLASNGEAITIGGQQWYFDSSKGGYVLAEHLSQGIQQGATSNEYIPVLLPGRQGHFFTQDQCQSHLRQGGQAFRGCERQGSTNHQSGGPAIAQPNLQNPTTSDRQPVPPSSVVPNTVPQSHALFDGLLRKYVSAAGAVNYAGFKREQASLEQYIQSLQGSAPSAGWPRAREMAYWINAYNAVTIKLILDNYPLRSIKDINSPWDTPLVQLGGRNLTLNNIENDILRPKFGDARIHFAVNCAAKSCPPLWNRAWTESNLDQTLDQRARDFINNPAYNQISASSARVSEIFKWYAEDFGNLHQYLNRYSRVQIGAQVQIQNTTYNWGLNQ